MGALHDEDDVGPFDELIGAGLVRIGVRPADAVSTPGQSANTRSAVGERRRFREQRKRRLVTLSSYHREGIADMDKTMPMSFICSTCGQTHEGFPALAFKAPAPWDWASEEERAANWKLQSDFCRFKDTDFYVRAVLALPIIGSDQTLEFGVWSTLSRTNFDRYCDSFEDDDQSKLGPMFGWFSNALPGYPETMGLKCQVLPQDHRRRPEVELEPTDHPLAIHQREGITLDEAAEYYHAHVAG